MSTPDLSKQSPGELLRLHSAILARLKELKQIRSLNNPTGDYAERLVADRLGLTLTTNSSKGYDAVDSAGLRYQIKSRRAARGQRAPLLGVLRELDAGPFDFLIAVVFDEHWNVSYGARIAHKSLAEMCTFRPRVNGHQMRFPRAILERNGVEDISHLLGASVIPVEGQSQATGETAEAVQPMAPKGGQMNKFQRASQIWAVLALAAAHRQSLTYSQIARATGAFTGGLGALLEPIQSYCKLHKLPPLTVLVVQQESGLPGSGFIGASAAEIGTAQAAVFNFDWLDHGNPGSEALEKAVAELPTNGKT